MTSSRRPQSIARAAWQHGVRPTRFLLAVSITAQRMAWYERRRGESRSGHLPRYELKRLFRVSTSRFGTGQQANSQQTPLGLHCIARKIGAGHPRGTIFKSRRPVGCTWEGEPDGAIVHRILWLEGLEPGRNRGGDVDTFRRFIYIHGFGDETTLGRPRSRGCIHLAAADLLPLFDVLPVGTLVWIGES
jgi:L,D-transpeptidase-like protein